MTLTSSAQATASPAGVAHDDLVDEGDKHRDEHEVGEHVGDAGDDRADAGKYVRSQAALPLLRAWSACRMVAHDVYRVNASKTVDDRRIAPRALARGERQLRA